MSHIFNNLFINEFKKKFKNKYDNLKMRKSFYYLNELIFLNKYKF